MPPGLPRFPLPWLRLPACGLHLQSLLLLQTRVEWTAGQRSLSQLAIALSPSPPLAAGCCRCRSLCLSVCMRLLIIVKSCVRVHMHCIGSNNAWYRCHLRNMFFFWFPFVWRAWQLEECGRVVALQGSKDLSDSWCCAGQHACHFCRPRRRRRWPTTTTVSVLPLIGSPSTHVRYGYHTSQYSNIVCPCMHTSLSACGGEFCDLMSSLFIH